MGKEKRREDGIWFPDQCARRPGKGLVASPHKATERPWDAQPDPEHEGWGSGRARYEELSVGFALLG